ncbi:MAG: YciK family oxidoreductase [Proteobacteria bacterium]|nr:YciK family oxidoreductase [Pseudomonadota bacterium]
MEPKTYNAPPELLRDRIILVTGSSDGIGRALALRAAALGAQIILHGRNVKKLEKVHDEIAALEAAPRPSIAVVDLATANNVAYESLADNLAEEFGRLDGLVHNAAIVGDRFAIAQYDAVQWQRVMHVNVTASFALTQVLLPMMNQAADPSIIFTSSSVGRVGRAFWGAYAVSKFATEGLSQVLADEHREGKLRVNCINPGATRTNMRLEAFPAQDRDLLKGPDEVLAPYLYLLGPDSKGITGQSLNAQ